LGGVSQSRLRRLKTAGDGEENEMTNNTSQSGPFRRALKTIMAGAAALVLSLQVTAHAEAADRVKVEWWNAANGRLAEITNQLISDFNASQDKYEVVGVSKGNYEETMAAMVAAYRVGQQPVLVQAAERGFLTMYGSGAIMEQLHSAGGRLLPDRRQAGRNAV
jgi:sn-glycerol 3-phosphate transport system substrate-binding protein